MVVFNLPLYLFLSLKNANWALNVVFFLCLLNSSQISALEHLFHNDVKFAPNIVQLLHLYVGSGGIDEQI